MNFWICCCLDYQRNQSIDGLFLICFLDYIMIINYKMKMRKFLEIAFKYSDHHQNKGEYCFLILYLVIRAQITITQFVAFKRQNHLSASISQEIQMNYLKHRLDKPYMLSRSRLKYVRRQNILTQKQFLLEINKLLSQQMFQQSGFGTRTVKMIILEASMCKDMLNFNLELAQQAEGGSAKEIKVNNEAKQKLLREYLLVICRTKIEDACQFQQNMPKQTIQP